MNVLNVQQLSKSYGTRTVFDAVSFAIDAGEKVGFIGANGSGNHEPLRENDSTGVMTRGVVRFRTA